MNEISQIKSKKSILKALEGIQGNRKIMIQSSVQQEIPEKKPKKQEKIETESAFIQPSSMHDEGLLFLSKKNEISSLVFMRFLLICEQIH